MSRRKATAEQIEKRRFWKAHIYAWQSGSLKQSQYCRDHQLQPHRFIYWKKKLTPAKASPVSLVEVSFPKPFQSPLNSPAAPLKVVFGDKYKVEVAPGFDPVTLKEIILTLGQV